MSLRPVFATANSTMRGSAIWIPAAFTVIEPELPRGDAMSGVFAVTHQLSRRFGLADLSVAQAPSQPMSKATMDEAMIAQTSTFCHYCLASITMPQKLPNLFGA